jgi:hypothetical protein
VGEWPTFIFYERSLLLIYLHQATAALAELGVKVVYAEQVVAPALASVAQEH